jgi:histidinol phosphatase-like PHP family hydrolase
MQPIIDAAVKKNVAIEIHARYRLPSPKFIKLAKKAGAKFSFGTNNVDNNVGELDYCLQMVRECGLEWQDMFVPRQRAAKK